MKHDTRTSHDLGERTARFGEAVISVAKTIPVNAVTRPLIDQIIRSSTSVGANYCEADDASSRREFRQKMGFCRKESREAKYWARMIAKAQPEMRDAILPIWQEAKELHLIFSRIFRSSS